MAINSYFYDSVNNDRPYSGADFAKAFGIICEDGVIISDPDGSMGFDMTGTGNTTITAGKAVVAGHFVENDANYIVTVPGGSYSGMVVIRVDIKDTRMASIVIRTDQIPQQDDAIYELPLHNVTVSNGAITAHSDVRAQGGAIASLPSNAVTWQADPNGVSAYLGLMNGNGKPIRLFLTSAQPAASSTEIRAWIQIDKF